MDHHGECLPDGPADEETSSRASSWSSTSRARTPARCMLSRCTPIFGLAERREFGSPAFAICFLPVSSCRRRRHVTFCPLKTLLRQCPRRAAPCGSIATSTTTCCYRSRVAAAGRLTAPLRADKLRRRTYANIGPTTFGASSTDFVKLHEPAMAAARHKQHLVVVFDVGPRTGVRDGPCFSARRSAAGAVALKMTGSLVDSRPQACCRSPDRSPAASVRPPRRNASVRP